MDVAAPGEGVVSLDADGEGLVDSLPVLGDSMPIVGTSYAAPVVSGIAALVRARSPHLTARQVMQRIKDTAHRPPAGWDPFVGHGVVDALAAVSGGTSTTAPMTIETESQRGRRTARCHRRRVESSRIQAGDESLSAARGYASPWWLPRSR